MRRMSHGFGLLILLALLTSSTAFVVQSGTATVLGVQYQQDEPYAEYQCLWQDKNYPTSCGSTAAGANVHVYLRNNGSTSVTVSDVTMAGYSLNRILREKTQGDHPPFHSIFYYWDNPPASILNAGEPVWYKADPSTIPPGGVSQVVVRLRIVPVTRPVTLGIVTSAGTISASVPVQASAPQLASVSFSPDLTKVFLHWRRGGGAAPSRVLMDGVDLTARATTVGDPTLNFGATTLQLAAPLAPMSYHVFQGVFADGSTATGSVRAWVNPFIYGTWGAAPTNDGDFAAARAWIDDATHRGVNSLVVKISSDGLADYLGTAEGRQYAADHGYGFVIETPNQFSSSNPRMWFIDDEPDVEESNARCGTGVNVPCGGAHHPGLLAISMLERGEGLRSKYPLAPTTINLNGSYKPRNYHNWGQVADVLMVDSYYQRRLSDTYWSARQMIPLYEKATVIYATSQAVTRAAEPGSSHVILYSNEYHDPDSSKVWPFPTPQSKRIEVYYALAGGAKGLAYWWFKPGPPPNGLGAGGPDAAALWKEIGLLGNEIKTVAPLLVTSHPVALVAQGSPGVWVRSLAVGTDSLILLVVNDQYRNDEAGFHSTPAANATVTATLPAWLASPSAFEIQAGGLRDVSTQVSGNQIQLNLGTLDLTRMIVLTTNSQLRASIQERYDQQVAPGVCAFAPDVCPTTPSAPVITQHPAGVAVQVGGTARFTVAAIGGNLSYRWQKNGVDLRDGGAISGATTASLQMAGVQAGDAGAYRAIVSNGYGSAVSNAATLTVLSPTSTFTAVPTTPPTATRTSPPPPTSTAPPPTATAAPSTNLQNGNFDASTSGWSVAPNWTSYSSGTATFGKETTVVRSSPNAQKIQPPSSGSGAYAGVRQTIAANVGDALTFVAWAYQDSPNTYETARLGARFDGGTTPPASWVNVTTRQVWTELKASGTVTVANGATVFLDVLRGGSGTYWSVFDNVSVYQAYLPPAPVVSGAGATAVNVDVQPGGNSGNGAAEYAITIGGGGYTQGTSWVQANGAVGTAAVWQTDATWGTKAVTGLTAGTTYTLSVKVRHSGTHPRETSLGAGAQGAPVSVPGPTPTNTPQPPTATLQPPTATPQPPSAELHRYWVKPDWLSPYWGYKPRDVAPAPAVNRSGEIDDRTSFRRARLTEQWQWFWVDLLSLSKYQRVFAELNAEEKANITRAFGGLTGDHLAFTNNAGSASKNCYPCGTTDRGEDMRIDPLICGGNTILGSAPVQNKHGQWVVKVYSFNANQTPPAATLEMLNDPRVLWATIISDVRLPDGSYKLFGFPQLKDGVPVPYPYMTMEDYYYPLEELEEYPLTDPKRPIYNP